MDLSDFQTTFSMERLPIIVNDLINEVNSLKEQINLLLSNNVKVYYTKLNDDVPDPVYATEGSVGFDICANSGGKLYPGETLLVGSGLKFNIPEGYHISVRPRSGVSLKTTIWIKNSPGTIDTDYTGEVCLILYNSGDYEYAYKRFDRLAQCIVEKSIVAELINVESIEDKESRGSNGFGSTGV